MKKSSFLVFPLLFALLTLALFLLLYRPAPATPGITSACLVFLTALGWSALIVFGRQGDARLEGLLCRGGAAGLGPVDRWSSAPSRSTRCSTP